MTRRSLTAKQRPRRYANDVETITHLVKNMAKDVAELEKENSDALEHGRTLARYISPLGRGGVMDKDAETRIRKALRYFA